MQLKMRKSVLWGHHYNEYCDMFGLESDASKARIFEFGCGPSAVNAERTKLGQHIISADPLFVLPLNELKSEVMSQLNIRAAEIRAHAADFDYFAYGGMDKTIAKRLEGVNTFLADFPEGLKTGRYLSLDVFDLPFEDFSFDYALCSHFLFAGFNEQTLEYHIHLIQSLARIAKEVRIFPLIDKDSMPSPLLGPVLLGLQMANFAVELRDVPYHVQPKGNAMLRVWAQTCAL